ncbi:MAG: hypothetical protein WCB31_12960 [Nitrososphaeraceae archaeon]|jgi:hypothetical protein
MYAIRIELIKNKKIMGITGMVLAVVGGVAWFFQQHLFAFLLWGGAAYLVLQLNKRKRNK